MFGTINFNFNNMPNPFMMGCCTPEVPKYNFFLGMASATAMPQFPTFPAFSLPSTSLFMPTFPVMQMPQAPSFTAFNPNFNIYQNPNQFSFNNYCSTSTFRPFSTFFPTPTFRLNLNNTFMPFGCISSQGASGNASAASDNEPQGISLNRDKNKYGPEFLKKVKEIAQRLNCNYRDLLGVMNSESGIKADAKNPNSSASGLIQFMEQTAKSLGTTTAALRNMSPIQQLDYVEKCISKSKQMAGFAPDAKLSGGQLYALIFLPARAKNEVLTSSGEGYYSANRGLDSNKDGKITVSELGARVKSKYVGDSTFLA